VVSSYRSSLPSTGQCAGTIDQNGKQMAYDCTDSICGTFSVSASKQ